MARILVALATSLVPGVKYTAFYFQVPFLHDFDFDPDFDYPHMRVCVNTRGRNNDQGPVKHKNVLLTKQ